MVELRGGVVIKEKPINAKEEAKKQMAAGVIPGPTKYSPPYPD